MEYLLQNNDQAIYQFTILMIFLIALVFFVYLYWYSLALKSSIEEKEHTKRQLLINNMELQKTQLMNANLEIEKRAKQELNLRLEQEVILKNKELTTTTLLASKHNDLLETISKRLSGLREINGKKNVVQELKILIRNNISIENESEQFKMQFEKVHPEFFKGLSDKHPRLSPTDLRHCAYIRMRLSTKEIARLFNINATSVQISRVRMKKKMELDKATDLRHYIINFP